METFFRNKGNFNIISVTATASLAVGEDCPKTSRLSLVKQVIRYSHLEVLTQEVVDTFIKRIYVYKDKKVEIVWNFRENG